MMAQKDSKPAADKRVRKEVTIVEVHEERDRERASGGHHNNPGKRGPRKGNSGSATKNNDKHETKVLKRRHTKMKEKTKELLSLVEELTHNCEYYKNSLKHRDDREEKDTYRLMKENEALNLQIFKLGQEIDEWRDKCQKMEHKNAALSKAKALTKENNNLLDDMKVLKTVICRLNKELSFYQDRLRLKHKNSPENIPLYSTSSSDIEIDDSKSGPSSNKHASSDATDWLQNPRRTLQPLLTAYDEAIAEKEEIIRDHELATDRFKTKCMDIVKENENLHKLIAENKERGSISINEWESLRANAVLVLEENDLLHDQADNLKRKEEKIFSTFKEKTAEFKAMISQLELEVSRQKGIIGELEGKCNKLSEDNMNMSVGLETRVPREKHDSMVQEFKIAFEELKGTYDVDRKSLNEKVASVEKERERLVEEVSNLETENSRLRVNINDFETSLTANVQAIQQMKTSMVEATSARDATNNVMGDFVKHIQQLIAEKNQLMEDLIEQRSVHEKLMDMRAEENELVGQLQDKIEEMERLHIDEVKIVQSRVRELEQGIKAQNERHRRETLQFNDVLKEKDKRIEHAEAEKRQLQLDLETSGAPPPQQFKRV